jgi:hypothetical protein
LAAYKYKQPFSLKDTHDPFSLLDFCYVKYGKPLLLELNSAILNRETELNFAILNRETEF